MQNHLKWLCLLILCPLPLCVAAPYNPNTFTPDNAAYWYPKAFNLYEDPNGFDLADYTGGDIELTPQIEHYLISQQPVIDLLKKAAQIKHCDWQYDPLANGFYSPAPYLDNAKKAAFLLLADGRYQETKNPDTGTKTLFEPVLQLASHMDSDDPINHLLVLALRSTTCNYIREYLNRHPNMPLTDLYEAKTLLRNESARYTITYKDTVIRSIENTQKILTDYKRYVYSDHFLVKQIGIPAEKLSEDFYTRNLQFYNHYMDEYKNYLNLPYPDAYQKITDLGEKLKEKGRLYFMEYREQLRKKIEDYESEILPKIIQKELTPASIQSLGPRLFSDIDIEYLENCDFLYSLFCVPTSPKVFSLDTEIRTKLNALQTGINLLLRYRKNKSLPDKLPFNNPGDLFSNKPFELIKTGNGFKLKCQGEDLDYNEVYGYEFKLPKD